MRGPVAVINNKVNGCNSNSSSRDMSSPSPVLNGNGVAKPAAVVNGNGGMTDFVDTPYVEVERALAAKLRNLDKRRAKLQQKSEEVSKGVELTYDQKEALSKAGEVEQQMEYIRELGKLVEKQQQLYLRARKEAQQKEAYSVLSTSLKTIFEAQQILKLFSRSDLRSVFLSDSIFSNPLTSDKFNALEKMFDQLVTSLDSFESFTAWENSVSEAAKIFAKIGLGDKGKVVDAFTGARLKLVINEVVTSEFFKSFDFGIEKSTKSQQNDPISDYKTTEHNGQLNGESGNHTDVSSLNNFHPKEQNQNIDSNNLSNTSEPFANDKFNVLEKMFDHLSSSLNSFGDYADQDHSVSEVVKILGKIGSDDKDKVVNGFTGARLKVLIDEVVASDFFKSYNFGAENIGNQMQQANLISEHKMESSEGEKQTHVSPLSDLHPNEQNNKNIDNNNVNNTSENSTTFARRQSDGSPSLQQENGGNENDREAENNGENGDDNGSGVRPFRKNFYRKNRQQQFQRRPFKGPNAPADGLAMNDNNQPPSHEGNGNNGNRRNFNNVSRGGRGFRGRPNPNNKSDGNGNDHVYRRDNDRMVRRDNDRVDRRDNNDRVDRRDNDRMVRNDNDCVDRRNNDRVDRRDSNRMDRRDNGRMDRRDNNRVDRRDNDRMDRRENDRADRKDNDLPDRRDNGRLDRRDYYRHTATHRQPYECGLVFKAN